MDKINKINEAKLKNEQKFCEYSKDKFLKNIRTKFQTCMIGALARFEQSFGYLWGHGKDEDMLSEAELEWRELWLATRTEILNNGNNNLRAIMDDAKQYKIRYESYHIDFIVPKYGDRDKGLKDYMNSRNNKETK